MGMLPSPSTALWDHDQTWVLLLLPEGPLSQPCCPGSTFLHCGLCPDLTWLGSLTLCPAFLISLSSPTKVCTLPVLAPRLR